MHLTSEVKMMHKVKAKKLLVLLTCCYRTCTVSKYSKYFR